MKSTFFKYLIFVLVTSVSMIACTKNNFIVDKDPLIPGEGAHFVVKPAISVTAGAVLPFSIANAPSPGTVYKIPVGVTTVSNVDRTINFSYTSRTAVSGAQYTAPASLTIKAGSALDTLRIQGLFSGYPVSSRKDTLKIKIVSGSGAVSNIGYQDSISLVLQKFCPLIMSDFSGSFKVVTDGWADYAAGTDVTLSVSGNTILFDYPTDILHKSIPIVVNPTTFATSVVKTDFGGYTIYGPEIYSCVSVAGANSLVAPCDGIIKVMLHITDNNNVNYGDKSLVLKKN